MRVESAQFPVAHCPACACEVLAARDLDDRDEWIYVCVRCATPLELPDAPRQVTATTLRELGYDVEGEGEVPRGCGSGGGCGTCASGSCAA